MKHINVTLLVYLVLILSGVTLTKSAEANSSDQQSSIPYFVQFGAFLSATEADMLPADTRQNALSTVSFYEGKQPESNIFRVSVEQSKVLSDATDQVRWERQISFQPEVIRVVEMASPELPTPSAAILPPAPDGKESSLERSQPSPAETSAPRPLAPARLPPQYQGIPPQNIVRLFELHGFEYFRIDQSGPTQRCPRNYRSHKKQNDQGANFVIALPTSSLTSVQEEAAAIIETLNALPRVAQRLAGTLIGQCPDLSAIGLEFVDQRRQKIMVVTLEKPFGSELIVSNSGATSPVVRVVPRELWLRYPWDSQQAEQRRDQAKGEAAQRSDQAKAESIGLAAYQVEACKNARMWPRSRTEPNERDICEAIYNLAQTHNVYNKGVPSNLICIASKHWKGGTECSFTFTRKTISIPELYRFFEDIGIPSEHLNRPIISHVMSEYDAEKANVPWVFHLDPLTRRWVAHDAYVTKQMTQFRLRRESEQVFRDDIMRRQSEANEQKQKKQMDYDSCKGFDNPYSMETYIRCGSSP